MSLLLFPPVPGESGALVEGPIRRASQRRRLHSARKSGGPFRTRSDPWTDAGAPGGVATGTGLIRSATGDCLGPEGGTARRPSVPCVTWQQSHSRAMTPRQSGAQPPAARSWAVRWAGAARATWTLSAAATTATTAERIPFGSTLQHASPRDVVAQAALHPAGLPSDDHLKALLPRHRGPGRISPRAVVWSTRLIGLAQRKV